MTLEKKSFGVLGFEGKFQRMGVKVDLIMTLVCVLFNNNNGENRGSLEVE